MSEEKLLRSAKFGILPSIRHCVENEHMDISPYIDGMIRESAHYGQYHILEYLYQYALIKENGKLQDRILKICQKNKKYHISIGGLLLLSFGLTIVLLVRK